MKLGIVPSMLVAVAIATGATTLTSCKKPIAEVETEPEPIPVATPAPVVTPAPATPIAVATPSPDPLAPPGIFFLLQKASITTDDGIVGLKPGQGLRQVSPGNYEVNGHTVQLRDDQVTNNLRIARQYASADAAAQAALRQALQATPTVAPITGTTSATRSATPAPAPVTRAPAAPVSALVGGSRLGAGTGAADPETANRRNVKVDSSGRHYWRDSRGAIRYDF
jgi:hypothetical protein